MLSEQADYHFAGDWPTFVTWSKHELSMRELLFRKALMLVLLEGVMLYIAFTIPVIDTDRFRVHMLYTTKEGQRLRRIESGKAGETETTAIEKEQLLHDTARMIDMESMPVILYISYLYDEALTEQENIYNAHIGAAEICHWFSLNGCADGYFGRPMRNLNDDYLEKTLQAQKKERFIYSLIMGKANTRNYVYRL